MLWFLAVYLLIGVLIYQAIYEYMNENMPRILMSEENTTKILFMSVFFWLPLLIVGIIAKITGKINTDDLDKFK